MDGMRKISIETKSTYALKDHYSKVESLNLTDTKRQEKRVRDVECKFAQGMMQPADDISSVKSSFN